jgi:hypothetical protein
MTNTPLVLEEQLLALIESSIIERYSGDLKRHEDPRMKRANRYTPLDTDAIRELLTTLWGKHITAQTIEHVFETLVEDGAKQWPLAYCEEDLEWERERYRYNLDHEIKCAEEHLVDLKRE